MLHTSHAMKLPNLLRNGPFSILIPLLLLCSSNAFALLDVSPSNIDFGDVEIGSISSPQTIILRNRSSFEIVSLSSLTSTGDFAYTTDCPESIEPLSSCTLDVTFSPLTSGSHTGTLTILGDYPTTTTTPPTPTTPTEPPQLRNQSSEFAARAFNFTIPLSGVGLLEVVSIPTTEIDFGSVPLNTQSETISVPISNSGNLPLTISSIATSPPFEQTNDCPAQLTSGSSCQIQVVFSPESTGSKTGNLSITTDTATTTIPLSGTAIATPSSSPAVDLLRPYTGGNPNVISTSEVIGEACPSGRISDRMQQDCNDVVGAATGGDENTASALRQITPESATKANGSSRQGGQAQIRNLGSRIAALRAGARGLSFQGLDLFIDDKNFSIDTIAQAYKGQHGAGASGDNPLMESRLGVFITGDISTGSKDETDLEAGLDFDTYGITMGVDYRITSNFILGGAFGYVDTNTELEDNIAEIDTQGYSLNLYGTYYAEQNYFVDFSLGYGANNFDQSRRIIYQLDGLANVNQDLSADYDGDTLSFFIGSGYDFNHGAWTFGPRADIEYLKSDVDGYTEKVSNSTADGGGWATRIDASDQTWLTLKLGGKLSYTHSADWGVLIPYTRLDWLHEFEDDSQIIRAHFVDDPNGQAIQIQTDDPDRDYLRLRIGTSAQFKNGMVGFIDFGTLLAHSDWTSNTISVGFRTEF